MYHIRSSNRQKTFNFNISSTRYKIIIDCALFTKTRQACSIFQIRHNKTNSETVTLSRTKTRNRGHEKFANMLATITLTFPSSHKNILLFKGKWRFYVQSISWWSYTQHSCIWQVDLLIYRSQNDIGRGASKRGGVRSRANVKLISLNNII